MSGRMREDKERQPRGHVIFVIHVEIDGGAWLAVRFRSVSVQNATTSCRSSEGPARPPHLVSRETTAPTAFACFAPGVSWDTELTEPVKVSSERGNRVGHVFIQRALFLHGQPTSNRITRCSPRNTARGSSGVPCATRTCIACCLVATWRCASKRGVLGAGVG